MTDHETAPTPGAGVDIEGLRGLLEKATPGPWVLPGRLPGHATAANRKWDVIVGSPADAAVATAAVNALPALLDEVERLREDAAHFENEYDDACEKYNQFEAERDLLAQAIWDARAALGFDTDGDTKFHSTDWASIAEHHVRDAREARADHDKDSEHALDCERLALEATGARILAEAKVARAEALADQGYWFVRSYGPTCETCHSSEQATGLAIRPALRLSSAAQSDEQGSPVLVESRDAARPADRRWCDPLDGPEPEPERRLGER